MKYVILMGLLSLQFFSCSSSTKEKQQSANDGKDSLKTNKQQYVLQKVVDGIVSPVGMASAKDGSGRLFVLEQPGKILIIKDGKVMAEPFLDLTSKVLPLENSYSEAGLLGITFHPKFKENGLFYLYYNATSKGSKSGIKSVISEFKVSQDPNKAAPQERIIMEVEQPEWNHNGGQIEFGPDGYLYIGLGDGGGAGDKHGAIGNGQDLNTLLGKILRIDVNNKAPYAIPADNPFVNKDGLDEIWAYGLRNPWRFSFDKATGRLFAGDVGQNKYEEVDIIEKGKNYGWRAYEGYHVFDDNLAAKIKDTVSPITEYDRDFGASVTGGYVYRGKKYPSINGKYFFADFVGRVFSLTEGKNGKWDREPIIFKGHSDSKLDLRINSLGEDEEGEIYFLTQSEIGAKSKTGAVYQLSVINDQ